MALSAWMGLAFLFTTRLALGINQHMICKSIDHVFHEGNLNERSGTLQGPAGKKGPPGVKGDRGFSGVKGERGFPGVVDYLNVSDSIAENLNEAAHCQYDNGGFLYSGKCYFLIQARMNFVQGEAKCTESDGKPADVLNLKHQILIQNYMRSLQQRPDLYVWLGMSYNPQENALKSSNGTKLSSFKWYPGFPTSHVAVGIESKSDKASSTQGIFDYSPSSIIYGVLCEK